MKRLTTSTGIILLAFLLIVSCGKDKNIEQAAPTASTVTLGVGVNNGTSRAGSVTIPDGHELRYILEVYNDSPRLLQRHELTATTADNVEFSFKLDATGDYKALLWADFVPEGATRSEVDILTSPNGGTIPCDHYPDNHYHTIDNLHNVCLTRAGADYIVNNPTRDAFFGSVEIKKGAGAYDGTVTLARPFGQLNLVEKNTALATTMTSATLTYKVPDYFDVETGTTAGATVTVKPTVSTPAAGSGILLSDYIFAPAAPGQTTLGEIVITFESNAPAHVLDPFTVPANTPVARNRRTNVTGTILRQSDRPSNDAALSITVSDTWDTATGDIDTDIDLYIPDANFRAYCIQQGYADANGYIIKEAAANVTTLDVSDKGIASLKGIEYFTRLADLSCHRNRLTTLDVSGCTGLMYLSCYSNQLSELDVKSCTGLTELSCFNNLLTKLEVKGCTGLTRLDCNNNLLSELDMTGCTGLTQLDCHGNLLSELDVTKCTGLTNLHCYENQITELDVTRCTGLTYLYCFNNLITKLEVKGCTGLTNLDCNSNLITKLDVKSCTGLTRLSCYKNRLTTLEVKGCSGLTYLNCSENQLSELDMTGCTGLTDLYCNNNQITELDVKSCTRLTYLDCNSNQLTELDATNMAGTANWQLLCGNQTTDGSATRELALTLRADQKTRWEDELSKVLNNTNVNATYP